MMRAEELLTAIQDKIDLPAEAQSSIRGSVLQISLSCKALPSFLKKLKQKRFGFDILSDLFAADFPEQEQRFEVVYNLLSLKLNARLIIKTHTGIGQELPSITSIHSAAAWYEREIFDMFGVQFSNNHDLRRILTDYGFVGHPLRKDFPLTGYTQVTYDNKLEQVIYEPVQLTQAYRNFDFTSPWQGPQNTDLPSDEKATKD